MYCAWCGAPVATVSYAPCQRCGRPTNGAQTAAPVSGGGANAAGIVIALVVGGLVVVAIIGILAAIAIPNLLTAMQRSKQKRTMGDLRSVATAWEARATDLNKYNAAGACSLPGKDAGLDNLTTYLAPTYVKTFPIKDGWGNKWGVYVDQDWGGSVAPQQYCIVSGGKDGTIVANAATGGAT